MSYNDETKEFICKSTRNDMKNYTVIYSSKANEWKCDCEASLYRKYERFESKEDRNSLTRSLICIHIIAAKIYKTMLLE
jgi:hypothetical protein